MSSVMRADETGRYLRALYAHVLDDAGNLDADVEVEVRSFRPAKRGPLHRYKAGATVDEIMAVVGHDAPRGDVYNGVHLRARGSKRGGDASVTKLVALICDIDCDKAGVTRERADAAMAAVPWGPPAMVVESGGGRHGYWIYSEPIDADEQHEDHRRASAWLRAWLNREFGVDAADDMSSRDRILRTPGTRNNKPERKLPDGTQPEAKVVSIAPRPFALADVLDTIPPAFDPTPHAVKSRKRRKATAGKALGPAMLPTSVPMRVQRVLAAAGVRYRVVGTGVVEALKLAECPACGQGDGCWINPTTGTLRTFHQTTCPAGDGPTRGQGLTLQEWVERFRPDATPALTARETVRASEVAKADRLALAMWAFPLNDGAVGRQLAPISDAVTAALTSEPHAWVGPIAAEGLPRNSIGQIGRWLAGDLPRDKGAVLVPMHDAEGKIRGGSWLWRTPGGAEFRSLSTSAAPSLGDDVVAGSILTLGSVPAATEAAAKGEDIYVGHGPLDYLALCGLRVMGQIKGAVLGIVGNTVGVLAHLTDRWARRGVYPRRIVVVDGQGANRPAWRDLKGVAGLVWLDTPGGLDYALRNDPTRITRRLRSTLWEFAPPAPIHSVGERMTQDLRQAVILAANSTTAERPTLVIYTPPPGAGKSRQAIQLAGQLASGSFSIPVFGRRPKGWPKEDWPPEGRRIGFAVPSHPLADEKAEAHPILCPDVPCERFRGALHYCTYADRVADAYAYVGRRGICGPPKTEQRCEKAATCPGASQPQAQYGVVSYITDAMSRNMDLDFCFVDESTGVVETMVADDTMIRTLYAGALVKRVARWRQERNPDAPIAAQLLVELAAPLAHDHGVNVGRGKVPPFPRRIVGEDLCRLLEQQPALIAALEEAFDGDKSKAPPVPFPAELRSGAHAGRHMPNVRAFRAMQHLRAYYRRVRGLDKPKDTPELPIFERPVRPQPMVVLELRPDATWALDVRAVRDLPSCPIVMLDATGELTVDEYRAAYPDRNVRILSLDVYGAQPRRAIHVQSGHATRGAMLTAGGQPTARGISLVRGLVNNLAAEVQRGARAREGARVRLGVLTYKPYSDAINAAGPAPDGLRLLAAELATQGVEIRVGYFGRDDRGTNAFEAVDGLAVVGDAIPSLGDVETDCQLLGLETGDVLRARASAIITQALFRARHTRRRAGDEPVLLVASKMIPHVPGIPWDVLSPPSGRPPTAEALAYQMVRFAAAETGCAGVAVLATFDWSGFPVEVEGVPARRQQEAAIRQFVAGQKWERYGVGRGGAGRLAAVWGRSNEAVCEWAAAQGLSRVVHGGVNLLEVWGYLDRKAQ